MCPESSHSWKRGWWELTEESLSHGSVGTNEIFVGDMRWLRTAEMKGEDQNGNFKTAGRTVSFRGHCTSTRKRDGLMGSDKNVPTGRTEVFVLGSRKGLGTSDTLENKEGMW